MVYQTLIYEKVNNFMMINIVSPANDPIKIAQLSDELRELCAEITWSDEIRVVILTGWGEKTFSMDRGPIESVLGTDDEVSSKILSIAEPIARLDRPVIAAINGDAIGKGLELALACDLRIAAETSCFALDQIKSGLIPCDGGTQRLSRLVGKGKALEMILAGESIDAQEAFRIGLVTRIVPPQELMTVVTAMAKEMASKAPIALRYTKEAISKGMDLTLEQGLRLEADLYLLIHTTQDRTEGIQAFREKKTPHFKGR